VQKVYVSRHISSESALQGGTFSDEIGGYWASNKHEHRRRMFYNISKELRNMNTFENIKILMFELH
jgi:hypothetical protein